MKSLKLVTPSRMSWPISSSWALPRSVMMQWKAKSMVALSWAFFIQVSKAWRRVWPLYWMAKSMSVVVPPKAAAIVPVWKSSALVVTQNFALVYLQRFLFLAGHQVDVELGDPHGTQALEFLAMLRYGADKAEAVDHFVADEIGVVAADFAVMQIVVFAAVFYEGG